MVTALEDNCPTGGQEDAETTPPGPPDSASVSSQPSRGEDGGVRGCQCLRSVVLGRRGPELFPVDGLWFWGPDQSDLKVTLRGHFGSA